MITFTPNAGTELQLTDEQLETIVGGCGHRSHHESSESFESIRWNRYENDCDEGGRGWHRDDSTDRCGRRERGWNVL